jgi:hypothetical protein
VGRKAQRQFRIPRAQVQGGKFHVAFACDFVTTFTAPYCITIKKHEVLKVKLQSVQNHSRSHVTMVHGLFRFYFF